MLSKRVQKSYQEISESERTSKTKFDLLYQASESNEPLGRLLSVLKFSVTIMKIDRGVEMV